MAYNPLNPNGQATMANSQPVVIASDQSSIMTTLRGGNASISGQIGASIIGRAPVGLYTAAGTALNDSGGNLVVNVGNLAIGTLGNTDNNSAATTSGMVFAENFVYNGTNWDRWRGNSSIGALVSTGASSVISVQAGTVRTSVSGTVDVAGSVAAWLQSTNASVITVGTVIGNQSVSGTVGASIIGTVPVTQSGTVISSISGNLVIASASIAGTVNVSGSVVGFQGGTQITSLVSTVPSSVLVGASIFGLAPVRITDSSNASVIAVGNVAHDSADSGNPVKFGGKYNAVAPSLADGDRGDIQLDGGANLMATLAMFITGEDQTNYVLGVTQKPVANSTYSPNVYTALTQVTNANIKGSAGNVLATYITNTNSATRYFQLHNRASAPSVGGVPVYSFPVPGGTANNPGVLILDTTFYTAPGKYFSSGLGWAVSTDYSTFVNSATNTEHIPIIHYI